MFATITILVATIGALIASVVYPIHINPEMETAIRTFFSEFIKLEGIFPIYTLFQAINAYIFIRIMFVVFKIIVGLLAMVRGSGKPEAE